MTDPIPAQIPPDVTDVHEQIAALRGKVDEIMNDQVKPGVAAAANQVESLAHRATDQLERLSSCVRDRPLTSIAVSLVAGYVLATLIRR